MRCRLPSRGSLYRPLCSACSLRAASLCLPAAADSAKPWMPWSVALGFVAYRLLPCRPTAWLALRAMCDEPLARDAAMENVLLGIR